MASQYLARLGIVLGIDSGELQQGISEAQKTFHNFKNQVQKDTAAAAREFEVLKNATEDYGKTLTKVEQIQREIERGRFMFASQNVKDKLLEQAKAYDAQAASMKKMSGALTDQQKMQVSYQLTDFFTQVASGQNVMIAFLQQGGQLKDTMGGIGAAFKAVASVFTPFRIAVGGAAAAFGTLAYAMYQANEEAAKFRDSMTLTGRYAGIAYEQFLKMGSSLSQETGATIGSAREVMQALVSSGKFTKDTLDSVGKAVLNFARVSGMDAAEAAKQLIPALDGTASSAKSLNDKYHFLTLAQYQRIEAMEREGRLQEAAKLTADALSDSLEKTKRQLGTLETAWKNVKDWASKAWDAMLGFGREPGVERAEQLQKKINDLYVEIEERRSKGLKTGSQESALKAFQTELNEIVTRVGQEIDSTAAAAKKAQDESKKINMYAKAGGLQGQMSVAREAQKAQIDAYFKTAEAIATEEQRIDIELQKKVTEAVLEEYQKNQDTFGQFAAEIAKKRVAKVAEAEAEAERKRFDYRRKQAWEAASKEFDQETEIVFRLMRERDKIMQDAQNKRAEQDFARQELDAKFSLIGASQKEIEVMKAKIEAQKELQRLMATKEFQSMSESEQTAAKKIYEDTMQAKIANIELAESLQRLQGMYDAVWSNMSSAIENFVRTGKFSIKDFTKSVIQDMLIMNMKLQAMALVRGLLGSFFAGPGIGITSGDSALSATGAAIMGRRASGGPVSGGSAYLVGERGPEIFMPSGSGTIIPNNMMAESSPVTNVTNNYINAIDAKSFEQRLLESNQTIWSANQYAAKNLSTNFGRT